jgi:septum site-determining protein MinC
MSAIKDSGKDSGSQTNSELEAGVNGDSLSANKPALPISVTVDDIHSEQLNGENGPDGAEVADTAGDLPVDLTKELDVTLAGDGMATPRSAVKIKGRPGGVSLELGEGEWDDLIHLLEDRLKTAEGFFRGGRVFLDVGPRPLTEEKLRQVRQLLEAHEMQLAVVRSTSERTLQAAMEVGVSTTIEEPQEPMQLPEAPLIAEDGPPNAYTPSPYALPPDTTMARPNHFVYRGSLRSGQVLRKTESIVIIGDVNPGAQVISGGDIMVWGRLRGNAHAGAEGNRRSVVAAIDFVPTQLRIANLTAIAPEQKHHKKSRGGGLMFWKKEPERRPEIARVVDGRIMVEPWDDSKPGGLGVWLK